jgi:hypothetical protein
LLIFKHCIVNILSQFLILVDRELLNILFYLIIWNTTALCWVWVWPRSYFLFHLLFLKLFKQIVELRTLCEFTLQLKTNSIWTYLEVLNWGTGGWRWYLEVLYMFGWVFSKLREWKVKTEEQRIDLTILKNNLIEVCEEMLQVIEVLILNLDSYWFGDVDDLCMNLLLPIQIRTLSIMIQLF